MNCSISDKVPEEPVVSKKSGCLFEKSLIERYISDFGKCPVTGEPLTLDDIVSVKAGKIVKPGPEQAASIPIQKETERPRKRPKLEDDKFDWILEKLPCGTHCYLFNNEFPFGRGIISLVVKAGMLCEENHEAGVAHFLEHLLLRASVEAANLSLLSDVSGPQNHEVTQTYTEFSFQFHSKDEVLEAVKLYSLIASRKVVIKPSHFKAERKIVAMEYKEKFKTTLPLQSFTGSIIKGASSIEWWLDNLDNIDVDIANDFYQKWYLPSNMALLITGSFDIKEILDEAKKSFCVENPVENPAPMFARTQRWTPGLMYFDGVDAPNALVFKTERASTLLQKWGMMMMVNATRKRLEQSCKCRSTIVEDGSNTFIAFSSFYDINRLVYEHLRLMKWGLTSLEVDRELAEIRKQMKQAAVLFPLEEHHQIKLLQSKFLDHFLYGREVTRPDSDVTLSKAENSNLARDALKLLNIEQAKINLRERSSSSVTSVPSLIEEVKKQHLTLWGDTRKFVDFDGGWKFQSEVARSVKNLMNGMREVELSNGMRVLLCCTTYPYEV